MCRLLPKKLSNNAHVSFPENRKSFNFCFAVAPMAIRAESRTLTRLQVILA